MLGGEVGRTVLRVVVTDHGAFLDFGAGLGDGFADLGRDQVGQIVALRPQGAGEVAQMPGAEGRRGLAPAQKRGVGALERRRDLQRGVGTMDMEPLARGGVDRDHRHAVNVRRGEQTANQNSF